MNPFLIALIIAGTATAVLAVLTWHRRPAPGAVPAAVLNLAVATWTLGYAIELIVPEFEAKVFWAKLQYPSIVTLGPAMLAFALDYTGRRHLLTRRNLLLLAILPLITVLLAATTEMHGLIWATMQPGVAGDLNTLALTHGPFFWMMAGYTYILVFASSILLFRSARRYFRLYSLQGYSILIAVVAPWVGNVMYLTRLNPFPGLDPTLLAFTVTGVALSFSLFSFRLFDVMPLARETVVESMTDAVIVLDGEGRVVDLNLAARELLGRTAQIIAGAQLSAVWPELALLAKIVTDEGGARPVVAHGEGKQQCIFELSSLPVAAREGEVAGQVLVLRDVTASREAEEALRASEARFRMMFYDAPIGMALVGSSYRFAQVNRALCQMLGYSEQELLALTIVDITHPDDLHKTIALGELLIAGNIPGYSVETRYFTKRREMIWTQLSVTLIAGHGASPNYGLGMIENVTERRQAQEQLRELATRDEITGLINRRELRRQLADEMKRFQRYGHEFVFVLIDVDHFKAVNDQYGHLVGDQVLAWVGTVLRESIRVADRGARYGGEEFGIIMPETGAAEGYVVAERLRQVIAERPFCLIGDGERVVFIHLTVSLGVASSSYVDGNEEELIKAADKALYASKHAGRNQTTLYQPAILANPNR